jgi:transcriptional enhancer factor
MHRTGLVKYEPMGRRKLMLEGKKSRGRNELVAASIEKDTGISRCRKQVSSHIQVLKGKLKGEPQSESSCFI